MIHEKRIYVSTLKVKEQRLTGSAHDSALRVVQDISCVPYCDGRAINLFF